MEKPINVPVRVVVKLTERGVKDTLGRARSELRSVLPTAQFRPYFEDDANLRAS